MNNNQIKFINNIVVCPQRSSEEDAKIKARIKNMQSLRYYSEETGNWNQMKFTRDISLSFLYQPPEHIFKYRRLLFYNALRKRWRKN